MKQPNPLTGVGGVKTHPIAQNQLIFKQANSFSSSQNVIFKNSLLFSLEEQQVAVAACLDHQFTSEGHPLNITMTERLFWVVRVCVSLPTSPEPSCGCVRAT